MTSGSNSPGVSVQVEESQEESAHSYQNRIETIEDRMLKLEAKMDSNFDALMAALNRLSVDKEKEKEKEKERLTEGLLPSPDARRPERLNLEGNDRFEPRPYTATITDGHKHDKVLQREGWRLMGVLSNKIDREELKPGDHIYSWRNVYIYAHHGIYAGEGKVIHFTSAGQEIGTGTVLDRFIFSSSPSHPEGNPCPRCGDQSRLDGVISSCIECFLSGGVLYRFEYDVSPIVYIAKARGGTCTLAKSDPPEDVLHRASYLLLNGFGVYHIFKNNCEDFAIYCKTGLLVMTTSVGRSGQAASFIAAASSVVSSPLRFLTTSIPGLTAVGCGMYCLSRYVSDIGVRSDVAKVSVEKLVVHTTDTAKAD